MIIELTYSMEDAFGMEVLQPTQDLSRERPRNVVGELPMLM
jgi:hypothetical protein